MDKATVDVIQAVTSCVMAAFTVGTFGALIWYTLETKRLRLAAQKQNEHLLLPILMLSQAAKVFKIRNVGSGPAFNAHTEPLNIGRVVEAEFSHPLTIAAGEELLMGITLSDGRTIEDDSAVTFFWNRLRVLGGGDFSGVTTISYTSANNVRHKVFVRLTAEGHQILFEKREHD